MKKFILGMLITSTIAVSAQAQSTTVMTFNIRFNTPADSANAWPFRKNFVASQVLFHKVQLLGVQEALLGQLKDLQQLLPGY